ncbi:MAG: tryptophan-rich sensory protein [Anaerolineaceae bacterium]|nr:tryptophan-rich sensory protein [Anaerolineaceae bacterium]
MKRNRILIIGSLVLTLVANFLANALPLNGLTTGEISDAYPILFVPAGYVFSIWGLIYLGLAAFAVYSVTKMGLADPRVDAVAGWVVASNLFNFVWIFLWHYEQFPLTLVAMSGLLVSLLTIYVKLRVGLEKRSWQGKLLVDTPFGIYLGWVTVATVANISQVLYVLGWRGAPLSEPLWTVIMLVVASLLGVLMIFLRKEVAYPLVLVWAFVGIWIKQGATPLVAMTALVGAILLGVLALGRWLVGAVKAA